MIASIKPSSEMKKLADKVCAVKHPVFTELLSKIECAASEGEYHVTDDCEHVTLSLMNNIATLFREAGYVVVVSEKECSYAVTVSWHK